MGVSNVPELPEAQEAQEAQDQQEQQYQKPEAGKPVATKDLGKYDPRLAWERLPRARHHP